MAESIVDYRIQVTATRGEQLLVERQFQASPNNWITVSKYLTADIQKLPKKHAPWMEEVPAAFQCSTLPRCIICGFPLSDTLEEGCVPGNCSYRPGQGTSEYERIKKRRAEMEDEAARILMPPVPPDPPYPCKCICPSCKQGRHCTDEMIGCNYPAVKEETKEDPEHILPSLY